MVVNKIIPIGMFWMGFDMGKMEEKRNLKRKAILSAARETFLSDGYEGASMDHIAGAAKVTKQTVYRYFPSKEELFKATLKEMGAESHADFLDHLDHADVTQAMIGFAEGFIRAHLSPDHIATYRLLVSEGAKSPQMVRSFFEVGPDETHSRLRTFFQSRLKVSETNLLIRLWTGMLLSPRGSVLIGNPALQSHEIAEYARLSTHLIMQSPLIGEVEL